MPFDYYRRLSARDKAVYRKSDAVREIRVPNARTLLPFVETLREAIETESEHGVRTASRALVDGITGLLGIQPVRVIVRRRRPSNDTGELHGYYTLTDERGAQIEVWMRTAANERMVAFRTYLRTLLHEVVHHVDFTSMGLSDSFHTQGFFQRESSLVRQIAGGTGKREKAGEGKKSVEHEREHGESRARGRGRAGDAGGAVQSGARPGGKGEVLEVGKVGAPVKSVVPPVQLSLFGEAGAERKG